MTKDIIYLIVISVLLFTSLWFYNRSQKLSALNDNQESIIAEKNDSIRYHINDKGRIVADKLAAEATSKQIAEAYPQLEKELKDAFDLKLRDLRVFIKNEIQATGQGKSTVVNNYYTDSLGNKVEYRDVKFNDGYLKFESSVFEGLDFGDAKYVYTDTITTTISSAKKWFLGKETLRAQSALNNPNAKVINTTNILINNYRDKRFCVYVGPGYDFLNNQLTLNVGVGYALIKF